MRDLLDKYKPDNYRGGGDSVRDFFLSLSGRECYILGLPYDHINKRPVISSRLLNQFNEVTAILHDIKEAPEISSNLIPSEWYARADKWEIIKTELPSLEG